MRKAWTMAPGGCYREAKHLSEMSVKSPTGEAATERVWPSKVWKYVWRLVWVVTAPHPSKTQPRPLRNSLVSTTSAHNSLVVKKSDNLKFSSTK